MINFVIVDDNALLRKEVNKLIVSKMMENKLGFNIVEFNDYSNKLLTFINQNKGNTVYFLDLELINGDGVDVARYIRYNSNNWHSPIIILTAHTSLYYEVYKQRLQILDFISKFNNMKNDIIENIDICLKMLNKEKYYRYTYKNIDYAIRISKICYIQRDGRRTKIVTTDDVYYQNISINEIKEQLPKTFIVSSKGTLINMTNVDKIDWNECLVYFKHGIKGYVVSKSHKKEIDNYDNE